MTKANQNVVFLARLKNIFISIIYLACLQCKQLILCRKTKKVYCTILYYHSIPDDEVDNFRAQINILKQLTTPIALSYDGPWDNRTRYSIITFDDAFKSVITNAAPKLIKLNIPFTIFIPAGHVGRNPEWLKNTGYKDESETIASVDELLHISSDFVTFGSHTVNHPNLNQLNYENAFTEITESKKILESQFKQEIRYLAFPFGAYNSRLIKFCHEAGYRQTFSIAPESPCAPLRKYVKGRIVVDPSDWRIEFMLKILGGYGWKALTKSMRAILKK